MQIRPIHAWIYYVFSRCWIIFEFEMMSATLRKAYAQLINSREVKLFIIENFNVCLSFTPGVGKLRRTNQIRSAVCFYSGLWVNIVFTRTKIKNIFQFIYNLVLPCQSQRKKRKEWRVKYFVIEINDKVSSLLYY